MAEQAIPQKTMTEPPHAQVDGGGTVSCPDWSAPQICDNPFKELQESWTRLILQQRLHHDIFQRFQHESSDMPFSDEQLQPFRLTLEGFMNEKMQQPMNWEIRAKQPLCLHALQQISAYLHDADQHLFPALLQGVPTGLQRDIPESHVFAVHTTIHEQDIDLTTHMTNWKSAEDHDDITSSLLQEELRQNWIVPFDGSLQQARQQYPLGIAVGKLSVACSESRPPRLVLDPSISGANAAFFVPEKQNLPTTFEVARAFPLRNCAEPQSAFSLDVKSAHKRVVVRAAERGLLMLQYKGRLYQYQVAPFGAKFSQHWWGRLGSFLLRFFHAVIYVKHAMYLFVDDYLLTSLAKILPLHATILVIICRLFNIPISWKKCTIGPKQLWIGWQFDFNAGLISLHLAKQQKLLRLIEELLLHPRVKRKHIERFVGLAMWCTALFPSIRVHLHWLYSDLAKAPATLYSCEPGDWQQVCHCLNDALIFTKRPPGTSIPLGSKLISAKHKTMNNLGDLQDISITERRIWLQISDPKSTTRKLSNNSLRVLRMFQNWLNFGPPLVSMRPKPSWTGIAYSDAFAQGEQAGIGGFVQAPNKCMLWFSLQLSRDDFRRQDIELHTDMQKDIVFLETLAQLALLHTIIRLVGNCKLPFKLVTHTDNTGTESAVNSLFNTNFPLALVLERMSILIARHGLILDAQHVAGSSNDDADFLSRWDGTSPLPSQFPIESRVHLTLGNIWSIQVHPSVYPPNSSISWLTPLIA
eukprot:s5486_g2.t1